MLDKILNFMFIALYLIFAVICGIITIALFLCIFVIVMPLALLLKLLDMITNNEDNC